MFDARRVVVVYTAAARWSWCGLAAFARWSRPRLTKQCRAECVASMGRSAVDSSIRGWHLRSRHEAEMLRLGVATSCSSQVRPD
jgi:hypothetical protein